MGPLRRGVILACLPNAAWAEVSDKERPNWSGTPVTAWSEVAYFFTDWFGLFLACAFAVALLVRTTFALAFAMLLSASAAIMLALEGSTDPTGLTAAAIQEGCIGPPHLSIAILTAITICTCMMAIFGRPKQES